MIQSSSFERWIMYKNVRWTIRTRTCLSRLRYNMNTRTEQKETILYDGITYEYKTEDLAQLLQEGLQRNAMDISPRKKQEKEILFVNEDPSIINETDVYINCLQFTDNSNTNVLLLNQVLRTVEGCVRNKRKLVKRSLSKRKNGRNVPENEYIQEWKLK